MRMELGGRTPNSERSDELLRFFFLRARAFLGDFLQDLAGAVLVANLEIGLRQFELGSDRLAAGIAAAIEAQVGEVEIRCGLARLRWLALREIEAGKIEVE